MPAARRILILGGYGLTGRSLSRLLLANCGVEITIAGRNENRAAALASQLGARCRGACVDARSSAELREAMLGHSLVVLAAPGADLPATVGTAALDCGLDYLDIVYAPAKFDGLRALATRAEAEGRCLVTEAGFEPGLPSLLVRWAALQVGGALRRVEVAGLIRPKIPPDAVMSESMGELVDAIVNSRCTEFVEGQWRELRWRDWPWRNFDFGGTWGKQACVPLDFEELHAVKDAMPQLAELRFAMAGFGFVSDWLASPVVVALQHMAPRATRRLCSQLLWDSVRHFTPKPHGSVMAVRYNGANGRTGFLALEHVDEYKLTAAPLAAFVMQWLDGSARKRGLHYMGMLADPARLIDDMQKMGITVRTV